VSYGSSGIVDRNGTVLGTARQLEDDMVVATIKTAPREPRPGWDAWKNSGVADEYARLVARALPPARSAGAPEKPAQAEC
jgi:predicted amidohydrolase